MRECLAAHGMNSSSKPSGALRRKFLYHDDASRSAVAFDILIGPDVHDDDKPQTAQRIDHRRSDHPPCESCRRLSLEVDSWLWNIPLTMNLYQIGASEVYLDGKLLYKFGTVGNSKQSEVEFENRNPLVISFTPTRRHLLAVRYSNFTFADYSWGRFERLNLYAGFEIILRDMNTATTGRVERPPVESWRGVG